MTNEDWQCHGWDDHEIFHLETGRRMSFRSKLQWLENADRMVQFLARRRRWIDKDGVIHEPTGVESEPAAVAEKQADYLAANPAAGHAGPPASDQRDQGNPPAAPGG